MDRAGRIRKNRAVRCLWISKEAWPISVRDRRPSPSYMTSEDGAGCPCFVPVVVVQYICKEEVSGGRMTGDNETILRLMIENTRLQEKSALLDRLLVEVARKFPDETRFDTALRYIRQAEECGVSVAQEDQK